MASLLPINHYIDETNNFIRSIESSNSTYFVYVARPQPWSNTTGGNDDTAITAVNNSVTQVELETYRDILYGKSISAVDISHVVPRHDWTSNTVYARYDQNDANLYSKEYFVVTTGAGDAYNVFKCIDNAGNTASTVKPALQSVSGTFKTGDGYVWKYMYTVDASSNTKFTTSNFIPVVVNTAVQSNAVPGTIDVIRLSNTGSGYNVYESGFVSSIIDSYTIKLPNTSSSVDNYYTKSSIYLKTGFGSGQVREISSYDGSSKNIQFTTPIDSYYRLEFANSGFITSGAAGEKVTQVSDSLPYTISVGYFTEGSNVVQTDTAVLASVLTSNSSVIRASRFNVSQSFLSGYALRDVSSAGTLKTDKATISNSAALTLGIVLTPGTGYTGNASVTITSATGSGGTANAQANSTGKVSAINVSNGGVLYASEPAVTVAAPTAQNFNANTDVTAGTGEDSNNVIALATANVYVIGDRIKYYVSSGNSAVGGLSNNSTYYIQFANSTVIALSNTSNTSSGNRIALTKGATESGHYFQGITATARILPRSLYAVNAAAAATFTSEYSNGDFIRVGENANTNLRRIESVNSTVIIVDKPFANVLTSANTFKISTAFIPDSISINQANGTISNTNLNSVRLSITNTSVNNALFIVGEKIKTPANSVTNATGTVVYSNSTTIFVSGLSGTFASGLTVFGESSNLSTQISSIILNPNVLLKNPLGNFILGENVYFNTESGSNTGYAKLINITNLSASEAEYEIGPTVSITGDGSGAIAIATVNSSVGMSNAIQDIIVLDPGSNYTRANVSVYANSLYGTGASALPVISPVHGHGSDTITELGSRYASIDVKFDTSSNEYWYYPSSVSFRKIGIIKDPKFSNATLGVVNYTTKTLALANQSGTWTNGEIVIQATSNATGTVISGNSTVLKLKDTRGTFSANLSLYAYTSGSVANVTAIQEVKFVAGETISHVNTNATAESLTTTTNTTVYLTNVVGNFANGGTIVGLTSNAVATINSIASESGDRNVSTFFTRKFNQTARITLSSSSGNFANSEYVTQGQTNATGRIISTSNDLDLAINLSNSSFSFGDTVINSNTSANAIVVFANSTYLKLTGVSNSSLFSANDKIQTALGATANVQNVFSVLVLSDVSSTRFTVSNNTIVGANSSITGTIKSVINPDLVKNSGRVTYIETSNNVLNRAINTTEEIRLVLKF